MKKNLKSILDEKLQPHEPDSLVKSFDIIGDIAVIRVPEILKARSQIIAEAIMETHMNVKTVLQQASPVSGEFRVRRFEWLMGEKRTQTIHKEFGCMFKVDLERCYFSPRLSFERMRIARLVKPNEIVVNMFAGVGCFSVLMAKYGGAHTVYSIDLNPSAVKFMRENVRLNRVEGKVVSILGDAKDVITKHLLNVADRAVIPLPEKAYEHLDYAVVALKSSGGWIHYYDFEHATKTENPIEKVKEKISKKLQNLGAEFTLSYGRVVRPTGPNWYQVVLDIQIHKKRRSLH
jgi:tRNA (guanine37-N1)-methyltransferase